MRRKKTTRVHNRVIPLPVEAVRIASSTGAGFCDKLDPFPARFA